MDRKSNLAEICELLKAECNQIISEAETVAVYDAVDGILHLVYLLLIAVVETPTIFSENSLDFIRNSDTIKSKENLDEGNANSGNHNHEGVQGQRGGSKAKNAPSGITKFKTSDGKMEITSDLSVKAGKSGKSFVTVKAGREIEGVYSFAGKGTGNNIVMSGTIAKQYGGKPEEWSKLCGFATVTDAKGFEYRAEIHWFEHEEIGQIKFKVKKR